jgi:DMSO reductase family type II enzyme heme b subunit
MKAEFVRADDFSALLSADAAAWSSQAGRAVSLVGTPAALQPTEVIRTKWSNRAIGAVDSVEVKALHDGRHLFFRLEWADATENRDHGDNSVFPDGAAIALPVNQESPPALITMGMPGNGINIWYWRANESDRGRHLLAEGYGTSRTLDRDLVNVRGSWRDGRWRVVIARALEVTSIVPVAQLKTGQQTRFGIVVWEGGRAERAGLKSFSGDWIDLKL